MFTFLMLIIPRGYRSRFALGHAAAGVGHGKKSHRKIPFFLDSGFEGVAVADGPAAADAGEDDPAAGRAAADVAGVPPKLVT
jgi:hypothetical protein